MQSGCSIWRSKRRRPRATTSHKASCRWVRWKTPPAGRLPQPLGLYHEMYPDVSLELYSNDPRELVRLVLDGKLDAALIADPISDKRLDAAAIYEEELVIVAEAKHPPIASPKDIPSKSILAFHPGCPHRQRIE